MTVLQQQWRNRTLLQGAVALGLGACVVFSFWWAEFSLTQLTHAGPGLIEFFSRLVPPDLSATSDVMGSVFDTVMIAFAGTFLAVVIAFPIGFLAASNVSPRWVSHPLKIVLGLIRSIPLILVALIFVMSIGLGPFAGTLAIAFHSIGMLGKFYAEEFETADKGIINAVSGTGATWLQTMRFGLLPQSMAQVISFTIYRFEMNFRDSTILGIVGAGGIGFYIKVYIGGFQYEKVAVLLLAIMGVVLLLDQLTLWLRKRIR